MSGRAVEVGGILADPWRSLRWRDYRAEVLRLSAYRPDRAASAARRGVLSELGEALGALPGSDWVLLRGGRAVSTDGVTSGRWEVVHG